MDHESGNFFMSECCECVRVRVRPTKRFRTYWCGVWLETGALTIKSYRLVNEQILEIFNFLRGTTIRNIFIFTRCIVIYYMPFTKKKTKVKKQKKVGKKEREKIKARNKWGEKEDEEETKRMQKKRRGNDGKSRRVRDPTVRDQDERFQQQHTGSDSDSDCSSNTNNSMSALDRLLSAAKRSSKKTSSNSPKLTLASPADSESVSESSEPESESETEEIEMEMTKKQVQQYKLDNPSHNFTVSKTGDNSDSDSNSDQSESEQLGSFSQPQQPVDESESDGYNSEDSLTTPLRKTAIKSPYLTHFDSTKKHETDQAFKTLKDIAHLDASDLTFTMSTSNALLPLMTPKSTSTKNTKKNTKKKKEELGEISRNHFQQTSSNFFEHVSPKLVLPFREANEDKEDKEDKEEEDDGETSSQSTLFTDLQSVVYPSLSSYTDLLLSAVSPDNQADIHRMLAFHVLNHCLISRGRVVRHDKLLRKVEEEERPLTVHEEEICKVRVWCLVFV